MRLIEECIRQNPPLKKEEMFKLITQIQAGNKEALDILTKHNLGLVYTVVKRYLNGINSVVDFDDLFQEGVIGLIRSFKTFNISQDNELSTYAVFWIDTKISRYIDDHRGPVRIPIYLQTLKRKYAKLKKEDASAHNDDFYMRLAAQENDSTVSTLRYAISHTPTNVRIDAQNEDGEEYYQLEDIVDENGLDLARMDFQELFNKLGQQKRYVIERKMLGWSNIKIAGHLAISRERVRQIEEAAILRMKAMINDVKKNDVFKVRDELSTSFKLNKELNDRKSKK